MNRKLWSARWKARLDDKMFSLFLSFAAVPVGTTGAIFGSEVSKAITNVLDGDLLPHLWGGVLALGGATTLYGIGHAKWLGEYSGLQLMAAALAFYSGCCYLGLGLGGVVSGSLAAAYTIACWYRSKRIFASAKMSAEHNATTHRGEGGTDG